MIKIINNTTLDYEIIGRFIDYIEKKYDKDKIKKISYEFLSYNQYIFEIKVTNEKNIKIYEIYLDIDLRRWRRNAN
jgi:hypothetical protein